MTHTDAIPVILIAEDDSDDYAFVRDTLLREFPRVNIRWVRDGEKLLDYLFRRGIYANAGEAPIPSVILLDLDMPRMSGLEALGEIRAADSMSDLPVVVLTGLSTQNLKNDSLRVDAFLRKPLAADDVRVLRGVIDRFSSK